MGLDLAQCELVSNMGYFNGWGHTRVFSVKKCLCNCFKRLRRVCNHLDIGLADFHSRKGKTIFYTRFKKKKSNRYTPRVEEELFGKTANSQIWACKRGTSHAQSTYRQYLRNTYIQWANIITLTVAVAEFYYLKKKTQLFFKWFRAELFENV